MEKIVYKLSKDDYIKELASKRANLVHVSNNNSKCGPGCLCLSFTRCTCDPGAPCFNKCYCARGRQARANVQACYLKNEWLQAGDLQMFFKQLDAQITLYNLNYFRFFECGDLPSTDFLKCACDLAIKHNSVKFFLPTKKYKIVNDFITAGGVIPDNLCVRFSLWCKGWKVDNPHGLPVAFVNFTDTTQNRSDHPQQGPGVHTCKGSASGPVHCCNCGACFNKKLTIVFNEH